MATIAWPLIILIVVVFILVLIACAFILVRFQHPDEALRVWIPKIVFIIGLFAAFTNVLLLPLDVANRSSGSTLDMLLLLYIVYALVLVMALLVIPFSLFFYESEEAENNKVHKQAYTACCYTFGTLVIFGLICGLMYAFMGTTRIPTRALTARMVSASLPLRTGCLDCAAKGVFLAIQVSLLVYMVSILAFVGLIMLVCYGGIGLVNLPVNLINDFVTRPEKITVEVYNTRRAEIAARCERLIQTSDELSSKARSRGGKRGWSDRRKFNRFKKDVYALEKDFRKNLEAFRASVHPWWYYIKLMLGCLGACLSVLWVIHIILYMILFPPFSLFLNDMLVQLDQVFALFGVAMYMLFCFYLLWAVIKGQIVIGLRLFIVSIHPLVVGETLISSLLVNVQLVLLSSIAVSQFCANAFSSYGRLTAVSSILSTQISNLRYTSFFFKNTSYFMVCMVGLTSFWYCLCGVRAAKKKIVDDD